MLNEFKDCADADVDLLLRNGVYPYGYMDSESTLVERHLPPRSSFLSRLRQRECSEHDYENAKRVWETLGCESLQNNHDLYLKCDVLQLADIFETFENDAYG